MHVVKGTTADDVWCSAAALFRDNGPAKVQSGRGGETEEVLHVFIEVSDPRQRWVVSRAPSINPAFALVEVFWIAAGRQDARIPSFWNPLLASYCGNTSELVGAYGYRLRSHFGFDQLDRVYKALQTRPDTRQAVLQIWDPLDDLPREDGTPARADIPCNVIAIPKIRSGKLEWLQVMRSNDIFRGLPYNFVQFTSLQEILAGWLGVPSGSYHHISDSLHAYSSELAAVRSSSHVAAVPRNTDSLALTRTDWDEVITCVIKRLELMASLDASPNAFRMAAFARDVPEAYENALRIIAADAARRRQWHDVAAECVDACTSAVLRMLWERWNTRVRGTALRTVTADAVAV